MKTQEIQIICPHITYQNPFDFACCIIINFHHLIFQLFICSLTLAPAPLWKSRQDRSPCCSRWHLVSEQPLSLISAFTYSTESPFWLEMPSTPPTLFILQKHMPSPAPLPADHSFGRHCLFNTSSWLFSVPCTPPMFSTETCVVSKQNKSQSQRHFVPSILHSYNDREINTETAASSATKCGFAKAVCDPSAWGIKHGIHEGAAWWVRKSLPHLLNTWFGQDWEYFDTGTVWGWESETKLQSPALGEKCQPC